MLTSRITEGENRHF